MCRCEHCLLEFPDRQAVYDEVGGQRRVFCCTGCNGIYRLIREEGLGAFYERRKWKEAGIAASLLKKEIDVKAFAELARDVAGGKEIDLYIDGIRCASCVWLNEKILMKTEGIEYVRVNYATHRARIRWDPARTGLDRVLGRILSIGYVPKPYSESERFKAQRSATRDLLVRFGTAAFLSSQLMIYSTALYAGYFQGIDPSTKLLLEIIAMVLTVPVIFYAGMPFITNMISGLIHLRFNMDTLIIVGAGSAFTYSVYAIFSGGEVYFDTAAMIITLILLGRYLEAAAKGRASETIEHLAELAPQSSTRILGDPSRGSYGRETVSVATLKRGDFVEVKPGEKIPLDGTVVAGESEVDESFLTGESKPVGKTRGAEVIGGSMNLYGTLVFEVTRTGKDTVLAGIIRAVENAQAMKPRVQALADRVVGIFVPLILVIALMTIVVYFARGASLHRSLMTGVSVLVIACPCSLGLATPVAVLLFAAMASSRGILIRGGEVVERAPRLTNVVFDKTGTITEGKAVLKETVLVDHSCKKGDIIDIAASVEVFSEHSIGRAISRGAGPVFPVDGFKAFPGKGVEGSVGERRILIGNRELMKENGIATRESELIDEIFGRFESRGDTTVCIGWEEKLRAVMVVSDVVRAEAVEAVDEIRRLGCGTEIVSGDTAVTTRSIASQIGVSDARAGVSPEGKRDHVAALQRTGGGVMMVGDGINDAPALTEASVGVAMGRGTDIAMESADVVFMRNDLRLVPYFIGLSRKTFSIIRQNIFWAFFYNVVSVPLAVAGLLHPIIAAGAMAASSLFVVGNSLRIKRL